MCPLRVILIFLSATIAGFFLIRGLNAEPDQFDADADESETPRAPLPLHSKVTNQRLFSSPIAVGCRSPPLRLRPPLFLGSFLLAHKGNTPTPSLPLQFGASHNELPVHGLQFRGFCKRSMLTCLIIVSS